MTQRGPRRHAVKARRVGPAGVRGWTGAPSSRRSTSSGRPLSPTQKAQAAKLRAEHRILPDQPLRTDRFKVMDARVDYRAESVKAGKLPVRKLEIGRASCRERV